MQEIAPLGMKLVAGGSAVADLVSIRRRNEGDTALTTQTTSRRRVFVGVCTRRVCVCGFVCVMCAASTVFPSTRMLGAGLLGYGQFGGKN